MAHMNIIVDLYQKTAIFIDSILLSLSVERILHTE